MLSYFQLETTRLVLRPHRDEDADFMVELNSDPEVTRFTGDSALGFEQARGIINGLKKQFADRGIGRFLVIEKSEQKKIGWCGLKWLEDQSVIDIGYRFLREEGGKGYATESAMICLEYGFLSLEIDRITAHAAKDNGASIGVLRKLGMTQYSTTDAHGFKILEFEILKKDYLKKII